MEEKYYYIKIVFCLLFEFCVYFLVVSFALTKQFPDNFLLGTATGNFQVEGAWDEGVFICY